ncbi:MAG: hypothetical protein K940chlam9_00226 [Chlamydiae bacterium]|nr:hypothetical protein [Chlamydiota bacterium]
MKKQSLATLAVMGISAGLIVTGCDKNSEKNGASRNGSNSNNKASAAEQMSPSMKSFHNSLSNEGKKKFMELDAEHKMKAVEMTNQSCQGQNKCEGMGGCGSENNSCSGHNSCKGQGGKPVKDPNKAVKTQHNNQIEQRGHMQGNGHRNDNNPNVDHRNNDQNENHNNRY